MSEAEARYLRVTQVRSGAGRLKNQRQTLLGLGLKKMNQTRVLVDTPETRGMIACVQHLVEWAPLDGPAQDEPKQ